MFQYSHKNLFASQTTNPGCCLPSSQSKRNKETKCVITLRTHRWLWITSSPYCCNEDRVWTRQKCLACSPSDRPLLNNQTRISLVRNSFGAYRRNPGRVFISVCDSRELTCAFGHHCLILMDFTGDLNFSNLVQRAWLGMRIWRVYRKDSDRWSLHTHTESMACSF